jgi:uncharacterized membrane protein
MQDPTTAPKSAPPAPRTQTWVRVLLGLSLAANFAVAGVVAGAFLRGSDRMSEVRELGFGPFTRALDDDDRRELRRAFIESQPDLREGRRQMRNDMQVLLSVLRADPFDQAAAEAALANGTERGRERAELGQRLILERLAGMTPAQRQAFADRLEAGLRARPSRDDDRRDRDGERP